MNSASKRNHLLGLLAAALVIFPGSTNAATVYTSAVSSGNWSNTTSWTVNGSGGSPVSYIVQPGHTITMNVDVSNLDTLIIHGTLTMGNNKELQMNTAGFISLSARGVIQHGSANTEIHFGTSSSVFIQGPFTAGNLISGGPRFGTLSTMLAANGDPQGSFPVALPLALKSAVIENTGLGYNFTWTALGEANQNIFSIESSKDGETFTQLGQVAGNPDLTEGEYSFALGEIKTGLYVRLTTINATGTGTLLTRYVAGKPDEKTGSIEVYPSLLDAGDARIQVHIPETGEHELTLMDASMQLVGKLDVISAQNQYNATWDLSSQGLSPGMHFLIIRTSAGIVHTQKLFVR